MISKGTLQLLRLPFSIVLSPIYLFAIYTAENEVVLWKAILVFLVVHLVFYPASNAYNSYMDQDTGAIAGIKNPPKATRELYYISITLDLLGLILSVFLGWEFLMINFLLVLLSRAYSWHGIRIKKYAWSGFLMVALAQGGLSFLNMRMGVQNGWEIIDPQVLKSVLIATLFVGAIYPITQIYQHEEDASSGVNTVSMSVGVKGTFLLSGSIFLLANLLLYLVLDLFEFIIFQSFMIPSVLFFIYWAYTSWSNPEKVNFSNTMKMILISAFGMNLGFIILLILK